MQDRRLGQRNASQTAVIATRMLKSGTAGASTATGQLPETSERFADCAANRQLWRRYSVIVLVCLTYSLAFAVTPVGFTPKLWQTQDGLPEQTVQAFAQTKDGYLWIGTTGGLLRFDGARFTLFDVENTPQLRDNGIFALLTSRDGSLWIGTEGGGLLRYRSGEFRAYATKDGQSDAFVRAIYEDRKGTVWVGTDGGLLRITGDYLERVDDKNGVPAIAVHAITEDHLGGLWVGGTRILRLEGNGVREYRLEGGSIQTSVKSILETQDHTVWVGTVSGLHKLRPDSDTFERVKDIRGTVRVLRQTSDGTFWVGMIGQGIRRWVGNKFTAIDAPDSLPSNTVLNIFEDDEKNLWIGTQAGMLRLTRTPVRVVPLPQATDSDFGTLYQDRDGTLWVISTDIFRLRKGIAEPYTFPQLGRIRARNVYRDRAGALWIGTDGDGVIRLKGKHVLRLTSKEGLSNNFVRAFLESRDGSMWIATDNGLSHLTPHGFVNFEMSDGLSHFSTRAVIEDRNGDVWIGTERGLSHLHSGIFVHDDATRELAQDKVWAVHEDSDGGLWLGTRNNGLYRWKQGSLAHYTTAQGLASNSIYQIVEDRSGGFWISGPNGISLLKRHELDRAAENPAQRLSLTLYGISEEAGTTQIYGGRQPSGCLDLQGNVWFPSNKGPIHILRDAIQPPKALPPVVINEVLVDGRNVPASKPIDIRPGSGRLELSYAPILLRSQEGVRFRYQLESFDKNWIDASSRRTVSYTNLPPGKYTFHVVAFEVNDPQAASEASLSIVQQPHFYRTLWFVACCLLVLAGLVLGIYRFRLWQIKMRFEAVLDERGRLAREMHDTVIQGCAGVSALLEAVSSLPVDSHLTRDLMDHARMQVRSTIDEARQAVWNLRQEKPSDNMLGPALHRLAEQIGKESGIPITCETTGKPFVLNQFVTHELMMMAREALYNAVLHASPENIDLRVCFAKKELTLEVRDNGSGFDPTVISPREERHYGLVGMQERVQAVGGRFVLESTLGKGTQLRIQIPRKVSAAQSVMLGA
jgi:ligand-binding sensor domain-containing protein/signal transduction histidine kinase